MPTLSDEDDYSAPVTFSRKERETEMDITPMVDVVFLLLIFFMITAAFGLQKSIAIPDPESEQSSQQAKLPEEKEKTDEDIVVQITKENRIFVEGTEAETQQELYSQLREHQYRDGRRQRPYLFVVAEADAMHETVVRVLDAASGIGMDAVRLKTEGE